MRWEFQILIVAVAVVQVTCTPKAWCREPKEEKPNILLIVADDMGYSDLGCYGGEIKTPNIDSLAGQGFRATNFYAAPSCSPSRSMLLTGTDNHVAGIGNMAEWLSDRQRGVRGYEGYLNHRVITSANMLREAGYHTYMAAKWHLGKEPTQWPSQRGFERDFSLLDGAGSHWSDRLGLLPSEPKVSFTQNGKLLSELPEDYYSSRYFTDFVIRSIDEQSSDGKPFFAYLGFQAPHGPLAVPSDWLEKYRGKYDQGYDITRQERLERQKTLGIVSPSTITFPRLPNIPAWDTLNADQRRREARKMELYAAMVEYMDAQVGRLINHLKTIGEYDNTLIIIMSDNGAAGEDLSELLPKLAPAAKTWFDSTYDNREENWGKPKSCIEYGPAWAQVSSVPFRLFKGVEAEGGIRVPLIVAGPGIEHHGTINHSVMHVMDLTPTFLEYAGADLPTTSKPSNYQAMQGKSLVPVLSDKAESIRTDKDWLGWELFGNRAIRQGDWKLLYLLPGAGGTGDWQLYNLRDDPAEMHDLSAKHPEKRSALLKLWDKYVKENGVVVSDAGPYSKNTP